MRGPGDRVLGSKSGNILLPSSQGIVEFCGWHLSLDEAKLESRRGGEGFGLQFGS